jgi:hypothetical protein
MCCVLFGVLFFGGKGALRSVPALQQPTKRHLIPETKTTTQTNQKTKPKDFKGYSTGDPKKRINAGTALGYVGLFGLVGTAAKIAFDLLSSK